MRFRCLEVISLILREYDMKDVIHTYCFSLDEMVVLMTLIRAKNLNGLIPPEYVLPDKERVVSILFELNKKGIVFSDDNKYQVDHHIEELLFGIERASYILVARGNEMVPETSIYVSESFLWCQHSFGDNTRINLRFVGKDEAINALVEMEWGLYIPEGLSSNGELEELSDSFAETLFDLYVDEMIDTQKVLGEFKLYRYSNLIVEKRMLLAVDGVDYCLVIEDRIDKKAYRYSEKQFRKLLFSMLGEK